jgi:group I intron endonuclease
VDIFTYLAYSLYNIKSTMEKFLMASGIYKITSASGKIYIGSSVDIDHRWIEHISSMIKGKHRNRHMQNVANKYGVDSFVFESLLICEIKDLIFFEQRAIDILKPEYNICRVAGSMLGFKMSDEARLKMSLFQKGRAKSPEHIEKVAAARRGKSMSEDQRKKLSEYRTGKKLSEQAKGKISAAHKGKVLSEEHRAKIAASNTGKAQSAESKEKISLANKGRVRTEEARINMSKAGKGKPKSPEHKAKMAEAQRARRERERRSE